MIDNDGLHGATQECIMYETLAGVKKVQIEYFERGGDAVLFLEFVPLSRPSWFRLMRVVDPSEFVPKVRNNNVSILILCYQQICQQYVTITIHFCILDDIIVVDYQPNHFIEKPSEFPTSITSQPPSFLSTSNPSSSPSNNPTSVPSLKPSDTPTRLSSIYPSMDPSYSLSFNPSTYPSFVSPAGNVHVKYYEFLDQSSLPVEGLKSLIPYADDYVRNIDFQAGSGAFASSRRENNVAALFEGEFSQAIGLVFIHFLLLFVSSSQNCDFLFLGCFRIFGLPTL